MPLSQTDGLTAGGQVRANGENPVHARLFRPGQDGVNLAGESVEVCVRIWKQGEAPFLMSRHLGASLDTTIGGS
jgi:hypothetical protein